MSPWVSQVLFWIFAAITLAGGAAVVFFRNPVSSAMSVVACFVGLAGLFVGLGAFFVGIMQILVYAGAVMVLFLFIIMLLDIGDEQRRPKALLPVAAGLGLAVLLAVQLAGLLSRMPERHAAAPDAAGLAGAARGFPEGSRIAAELSAGRVPDVHLIGHTLFTGYNMPLQVVGVLLLVATIGVVVLSRRHAD